MNHLPVLQVVLPLLAAPVAILLRRPRLVALWAMLVTIASAAIAWSLFARVMASGPVLYAIGGWDPPLGIAYRLDAASVWMLALLTTVGAVVACWAPASLQRDLEVEQQRFFWAAYLLNLAGILGMAVTVDAFNAFVFLEISSLSTYVLIGLGRDRRALLAAFRYLVLGSIGGTFVLIGIGLLYQMTGTLNMMDLAQRLGPVLHTRTILVSFAFITVGTGLKFALWPLHRWLPAAYATAPSAVAALIAASGTKIMLYLLMRFALGIYGASFVFDFLGLSLPLLGLALTGIVITSVGAIVQTDVRRLLAFSSVAQVGYIVVGLATGTEAGLAAGLFHLMHHGLTKGAMFLAVGTLFQATGTADLRELRGLASRMPWTFAALLVGGLGLIGVPGTMGFVSKVLLCRALIDAGDWPVMGIVLLTSMLAVGYVWRIVESMWLAQPTSSQLLVREVPKQAIALVWALAAITVVAGVWSEPFVNAANAAAHALYGGF